MDAPTLSKRSVTALGALAGIVAAIVALGIAELIAGIRQQWRSPVIDVGDRVIFAAGVALGSGSALAARVGGEEFALLFRGAPAAVAIEAERLRQRISAYVKQMVPLLERPVTASMGLVHIGRDTSFGAAMKSADINLYAAKESGRNRVVFIEAA